MKKAHNSGNGTVVAKSYSPKQHKSKDIYSTGHTYTVLSKTKQERHRLANDERGAGTQTIIVKVIELITLEIHITDIPV